MKRFRFRCHILIGKIDFVLYVSELILDDVMEIDTLYRYVFYE